VFNFLHTYASLADANLMPVQGNSKLFAESRSISGMQLKVQAASGELSHYVASRSA